ncbi:Kinesin-like protein KIN-13B [Sesamum angolense]|uniref:Kinesin-like protein n=1 Tax=Sesamum angolense TaxID=2727404 RepID=A0AAE1XER0_9LAMI|nr:Kinesin-like protein KIN-13B [Sesamum angolense]
MNAVGRQRSGAPPAHHQRQYSDNFLESSSNGRWLQSAGLQHLQSSNNAVPPVQDFGYYNGGGQGPRMYRSVQAQRTYSGGSDLFAEPLTPPGNPRRKNGEEQVSPNECSPGLLDLHSFDTELLPEMSVPGLYDGPPMNHLIRGRSFDDSDPYFGNNKQTGKARGLPESNVLKSIAADNVKASNVAKIKVVVRKRPLNKKELAKNDEDIIETYSNSLVVHETKLKVDLTEYVWKNMNLFIVKLWSLCSDNFPTHKATCFAYGQTGSGKTYTMKPLPLKAVRDILRLMHHTYRNQGFQLKLCMREDGKQQVCIVGLQEYRVVDVETIKELIERGNATRSTGTTGANEESSRSHAILQLTIKRSTDGSESKPPRVVGKLSFIDLAGSERGADTTDNDKQTRMEGAEINKSLLALKECIRALDNDQGHIPFRGSKLTEVLRDSFVGNSRTVMISCISPNSGSCEHTLNTLRYADRQQLQERRLIFNHKSEGVNNTTLVFSCSPCIDFRRHTGDSWPEQTDREEYDEDFYEQEKPSWKKNSKIDSYNFSNSDDKVKRTNGQTKWKEPPKSEMKYSNSDEDLNALLKEEEELVNAHRKQVEETMDIVREEMNLLVEADRPGNQLDDYISRLNSILSQKLLLVSYNCKIVWLVSKNA